MGGLYTSGLIHGRYFAGVFANMINKKKTTRIPKKTNINMLIIQIFRIRAFFTGKKIFITLSNAITTNIYT